MMNSSPNTSSNTSSTISKDNSNTNSTTSKDNGNTCSTTSKDNGNMSSGSDSTNPSQPCGVTGVSIRYRAKSAVVRGRRSMCSTVPKKTLTLQQAEETYKGPRGHSSAASSTSPQYRCTGERRPVSAAVPNNHYNYNQEHNDKYSSRMKSRQNKWVIFENNEEVVEEANGEDIREGSSMSSVIKAWAIEADEWDDDEIDEDDDHEMFEYIDNNDEIDEIQKDSATEDAESLSTDEYQWENEQQFTNKTTKTQENYSTIKDNQNRRYASCKINELNNTPAQRVPTEQTRRFPVCWTERSDKINGMPRKHHNNNMAWSEEEGCGIKPNDENDEYGSGGNSNDAINNRHKQINRAAQEGKKNKQPKLRFLKDEPTPASNSPRDSVITDKDHGAMDIIPRKSKRLSRLLNGTKMFGEETVAAVALNLAHLAVQFDLEYDKKNNITPENQSDAISYKGIAGKVLPVPQKRSARASAKRINGSSVLKNSNGDVISTKSMLSDGTTSPGRISSRSCSNALLNVITIDDVSKKHRQAIIRAKSGPVYNIDHHRLSHCVNSRPFHPRVGSSDDNDDDMDIEDEFDPDLDSHTIMTMMDNNHTISHAATDERTDTNELTDSHREFLVSCLPSSQTPHTSDQRRTSPMRTSTSSSSSSSDARQKSKVQTTYSSSSSSSNSSAKNIINQRSNKPQQNNPAGLSDEMILRRELTHNNAHTGLFKATHLPPAPGSKRFQQLNRKLHKLIEEDYVPSRFTQRVKHHNNTNSSVANSTTCKSPTDRTPRSPTSSNYPQTQNDIDHNSLSIKGNSNNINSSNTTHIMQQRNSFNINVTKYPTSGHNRPTTIHEVESTSIYKITGGVNDKIKTVPIDMGNREHFLEILMDMETKSK